MKKFLAVLLSALLLVSLCAVSAAAVNWEDGQTVAESGNYTFDNAYEFVFKIGSVNGKIAGEDATIITTADAYNASNPNWAISVLLAPTAEANVYEVALAPVVTPGSAAAGIEKGINFDNGNVVMIVHSSGSLPESTKEDGTVQTFANWQAKVASMALKVGDKVTFAGIDLAAGTATDATVTVQDAPEGYEVPKVEEEPAMVPEVITVDGDLSDNGWAKDGWTEVNEDNGYWQAEPKTDDTISYKYQLRTDDTKLYVAFEIDCAAVAGGNGTGTNVRFWINSDAEYKLYTHFYDVYLDGVASKYNTAKEANSGANIENSTINAFLVSKDGKTYVEFSVDLAEFGGEEGFTYFVCVSNKVNENICLYDVVVPAGADGSRTSNLPWAKWYFDGDNEADVEALALGEVEAGNEDDKEEDKEDDKVTVPVENVAAGKSYTTSPLFGQNEQWQYDPNAAPAYPDEEGKTLTDGIFPANDAAYDAAEWVGFNSNMPVYETNGAHSITVDLGESMDLAKFVIWYGTKALSNGIGAPTGVEIYVSEDGETWGEAVGSATPANNEAVVNESAVVEAAATGRYVQFRFTSGGWAFISEVEVYNAGDADVDTDVSTEESTDKEDDKEDTKPGDASSMLVFALIAIVSLAGTAVIVKNRK